MRKLFSFIWRKKYYFLVLILIGALVLGVIIRNANKNKLQYNLDTVKKETIVDLVSDSGNVVSEGQAEIYPTISGSVSRIYVENGQKVYAGQSLFTIRSDSSQKDRDAAYAAYLLAQNTTKTAENSKTTYDSAAQTAQASVYTAENNYNSISKAILLGTRNPTTNNKYSVLELNSAKATLDAARLSLDSAQAQYDQAESAYQAAMAAEESALKTYELTISDTVKSPISGTVTNLNISVNDKVTASQSNLLSLSSATSAPSLIIANLNKLMVKIALNEVDITKIKIDQQVKINFDAISNKEFDGVVAKLDSVGTNTSGVITYNVYVSITNPDENIKPQMSATADITVATHENVLTVANSAIKNYQNGKAVQIFDSPAEKTKLNPKLKYIPVTLGIRGVDRTEITSGLNEGDEVVIVILKSSSGLLGS